MELYYAVHFEQLDYIMEHGLGIRFGETECIPIQLVTYSHWAEGMRLMADYKCGVESTTDDIVVLSVQMASIEARCEEYLRTGHGTVTRYICTDIIDSSELSVLWADYTFSLKEFMCLNGQLRYNGIVAGSSEALMKCVQWYAMGNEKREALFNIIGRWRASHVDDLAALTGYSADVIKKLWWHHESAIEYFVRCKESYEIGRIIGMYESGFSIEEIKGNVKWDKHGIEEILKAEGLLDE